jgi:chromosome segregation ATPase
VGLEKENMNMKSRADLLREKEGSYNEDLAFCKNQMDEMVEKEKLLMIQLKGLEEEDSELEKKMAALEDTATQAMEEAKLTEAGNKELEEKINESMGNILSSAHILKNLVKEETSVQKNLHSAKTETEQITAAVASAEEEGKLKVEAIEGAKKKEKEVTIKLSALETGITKKLEMRQLLQSKLDNFVIEEGKLRSLMELKRNDFLKVEKTKKALDKENLTINKDNEVLSVDKVKLLDTMAALDADLEVKRSHLVGMDIQVAKEMEITRKKYEESQAELEEVKKDVLGMVSTEEGVVKELEAIELEIKSQKLCCLRKPS